MNPNEVPCGICVLNAVRRGVSFDFDVPPASLVGQQINDGTEIHHAATVFAGTPVCFYHVDDAAKAAGL